MGAEVRAGRAGSVWQVLVQVGDVVSAGDTLLILESMKMEISIESPATGTVEAVLAVEGEPVDESTVVVIVA